MTFKEWLMKLEDMGGTGTFPDSEQQQLGMARRGIYGAFPTYEKKQRKQKKQKK